MGSTNLFICLRIYAKTLYVLNCVKVKSDKFKLLRNAFPDAVHLNLFDFLIQAMGK